MIFYEIDEFIYLKDFNDIKMFLNQSKFDKCDAVFLNWVHRSDNNKLHYENKTLSERFPKRGKIVDKNKRNPLCSIKTIIRGSLNNIHFTNCHFLFTNLNGCNGYGKKNSTKGQIMIEPDYDNYYINHYFGKSTEEFVNKVKRGDILRGKNLKMNMLQVYRYFVINELTYEKLSYIERHLGSRVNLTEYRLQLKTKKNI